MKFKILGATESGGIGFSNGLWNKKKSNVTHPLVENKRKYERIFIQRIK